MNVHVHCAHRGLVLLLAVAILSAVPPTRAAGISATLVKDFDTTLYQPGISVGRTSLGIGSTLFFTATDNGHGEELWSSDGTPAGTAIVKDIAPGSADANIQHFTDVNGVLLFFADDGAHGQELWRSDGTAAGTVLVKDIFPGTASALYPYQYQTTRVMVVVGSLVFFVANDGVHGPQLWASDGTTAGTYVVKIINAISTNPYAQPYPTELTNVAGTLFFKVYDQNGATGTLWKSTGTETSTVPVATLTLADPSFSPLSNNPIRDLTAVGRTLFFWSAEGLWRSDGTATGTIQLTHRNNSLAILTAANGIAMFFDSNPDSRLTQLWGSDGSIAGTTLIKEFPIAGNVDSYLTMTNGDFVFLLSNNSGYALWKSDGTAAGTVLLKQFTASVGVSPLTDVSGTLFFVTDDGHGQATLWQSNGTPNGTLMVTLLNGAVSNIHALESLSVAGQFLFGHCEFAATCQIWGSDGTAANTKLLREVQPSAMLDLLGVANNTGFFRTCHGADGCVLIRTDGTLGGTVDLTVPENLSSSLVIREPQAVGKKLFFVDGLTGSDLWVSDSTSAGTQKLMGVSGSLPIGYLTRVGDSLFFAANAVPDPSSPWTDNRTLWVSDGTPAGTRELVGGLPAHPITLLVPLGTTLFFVDRDSAGGAALWRSDGTLAGTTLVRGGFNRIEDLQPFADGLALSADGQLWRSDGTPAGTTLIQSSGAGALLVADTTIFSARCDERSCALWASDGTTAGTRQMYSFDPIVCGRGCDGPNVNLLLNAGGRLFFTARRDGIWGLWSSDGTPAGTVLLTPTIPDIFSSIVVGTRLFFTTDDGVHGHELWTSDGTTAGTHMVKDISPGFADSTPMGVSSVDGRLFFSAADPDHGRELWVSDGTTTGTTLVADINPGPASSLPAYLTPLNGQLFLSAWSPDYGTELWVSDRDGTRMVQDVNPGVNSANPTTITAAGPNLFFSANDGVNGPALWMLPLTSQPYRSLNTSVYTRIEAENFDRGGEGLAYHDLDPTNHNLIYRPGEGVDLQTAGGATYLAYASAGEWLRYTVETPYATHDNLSVQVASLGPGGDFHVEVDGNNVSGPMTIPDTGGWSNWITQRLPDIVLEPGRHVITLQLDRNGSVGTVGNFDWFELAAVGRQVVALPIVSQPLHPS
ncbi:MAG: ELWxxDGT repeat protein [Chloroflexales bacterium]